MSGGYFDYEQYHIHDIANSVEAYIFGRELEDCDIEDYINDFWEPLSAKQIAWIRKHKRTLPNLQEYGPETIREMKKGMKILRKACVYAQRIDWLICGDDGEDTFRERLKKELVALEKGGIND